MNKLTLGDLMSTLEDICAAAGAAENATVKATIAPDETKIRWCLTVVDGDAELAVWSEPEDK